MNKEKFYQVHIQIQNLEGHRDYMKVVCAHACTYQATQAVHGSGAWPGQSGHMLPNLRLLSYDPFDLPDAKSEHGIVEILILHFK